MDLLHSFLDVAVITVWPWIVTTTWTWTVMPIWITLTLSVFLLSRTGMCVCMCMCTYVCVMILGRWKPKFQRKTCFIATLSIRNSTWPILELNLSVPGEKPANNCLSYEMTLLTCSDQNYKNLITSLNVISGDFLYHNYENLLQICGMNWTSLPFASLQKTVSENYFVISAADVGCFETLVLKMKSR